MKKIDRILIPVDLSGSSMSAIELATSLARQHGASLMFVHVSPLWQPQETLLGSEYLEATIVEDEKTLMGLRPADDSVEYDHRFVQGNPGPEIVRVAESCDMIIMTSHGYTGISRLLMGSVAEYVVRHAPCPVLTLKTQPTTTATDKQAEEKQQFVTDVMHHSQAVLDSDTMTSVISQLDRTHETAAPVVDFSGQCIGILTKTDIDKYRELQERFEQRDKSVIKEMFEADKYGQRRADNVTFDTVQRHMTSPVVTISNREACHTARELFDKNREIHHLVVVDESDHPVGILASGDVQQGKLVERPAKS